MWKAMDSIVRDIRYAALGLVRTPSLTFAVVATLALAIAVANTVFTVANAMILRGLPVPQPEQIVSVSSVGTTGRELGLSYKDYDDWRRRVRSFAGIAVYSETSMELGDDANAPSRLFAAYVAGQTFDLLREVPMVGRPFRADDDRAGAAPVVILGYEVWRDRYHMDRSVVGRAVRVNGVTATVIGVMPEGFAFPLVSALWRPLSAMPGIEQQARDARVLRGFGRLGDGATLEAARSELNGIASRLATEFPTTNTGVTASVRPFTGSLSDTPLIPTVFAGAAFVLLIACANVANLLLVRSLHRSGEMSLRAALGATRGQILRLLLVENGIFAALAGVAGLGLSVLGVRAFAYSVQGILFPYWYRDNWTMDGRVFVFLAATCLASGLMFGLVPALYGSRRDLTNTLLEGSARTAGRGRVASRATSVLLVAQFAFTLVLLAGATLMGRSFIAIYRADAVVDSGKVSMMTMVLPATRYATPDQRVAFEDGLLERLRRESSVEAAAFASVVPFGGAPIRQVSFGVETSANRRLPDVSTVAISDGYFRTLGLGMIEGRDFDANDGRPGLNPAIVNAKFVELYFRGRDPIGQRIRLINPGAQAQPPRALTIVGVSPTVRQQYMQDIDPVVFTPLRSTSGPVVNLMVRGWRTSDMAAVVRRDVNALDPEFAQGALNPLDSVMTQSRWGHRVFGLMLGVFSAVALILSIVGTYALMAYAVSQRTQEIAVRMALGAGTRHIVGAFLLRAACLLVPSLIFGGLGAYGAERFISSLLVDTASFNAVGATAIAIGLSVVIGTTTWSATRKATKVNLAQRLRFN